MPHHVSQSTLDELGFISEHDRPIVEGIRRLRGRMTRRQLCKEFNISHDKLVRIIKRYGLQYKEYTRQRYNAEYDCYLAKRQIANEIAAMHNDRPFKSGDLQW